MVPGLSSPEALAIIVMTTTGSASGDKVGIMKTLSFQYRLTNDKTNQTYENKPP